MGLHLNKDLIFFYVPFTIIGTHSTVIQIKDCQTGKIDSESNLSKLR